MKKKILITLTLLVLVFCICFAVACDKGHKEPIIPDEKTIVISVEKNDLKDGEMTLLEYMEVLKNEGKLEFTVNNGMVTSINNVENAQDYSSCWMLYTSDTENSNEAWGTVKYNEKNYASSTLGAESLIIKEGQLYIWAYITF